MGSAHDVCWMCLYGEGVVLAVLVLERMGGGGGERVVGGDMQYALMWWDDG